MSEPYVLQIRLSPEERSRLTKVAEVEHLPLATWGRVQMFYRADVVEGVIAPQVLEDLHAPLAARGSSFMRSRVERAGSVTSTPPVVDFHAKIFDFLSESISQFDNPRVELFYAVEGSPNELIEEILPTVSLELLALDVFAMAALAAKNKGPGRHRFVLRLVTRGGLTAKNYSFTFDRI